MFPQHPWRLGAHACNISLSWLEACGREANELAGMPTIPELAINVQFIVGPTVFAILPLARS